VINSVGESGKDDLRQAVHAAVSNKRAGGMELIWAQGFSEAVH